MKFRVAGKIFVLLPRFYIFLLINFCVDIPRYYISRLIVIFYFMTAFDIVVGLILIFVLIKGFINGFVVELASVLAILLGLVVAVLFCHQVGGWINGIYEFKYAVIVAFILLFLIISIGIHFAAKALDSIIDKLPLSIFNRIAGALFASLKMVFLISIFVNIVSFFDKEKLLIDSDKVAQSYLYEPVKSFAPMILDKLNVDSPFDNIKKQNPTFMVLT